MLRDRAVNRFGLSRLIPADIKRRIRQESGFGCVLCGIGIYEYEHVDPLWIDAKIHDPSKITLLCSQHHRKVTNGMMSKETIKLAMQAPFCNEKGFSREYFDFQNSPIELDFGGMILKNCEIPIQIFGENLFSIRPPEQPNTPFLLSGNFYDSKGYNSLRIVDNEWYAWNSNWDVEVIGPAIIIREGLANINLKIVANPPTGIRIERLKMQYKTVLFTGDGDSLDIKYENGKGMNLKGCLFDNCRVGVSLN